MLPAPIAARTRTAVLCALAALIPWPFMYSAWALVALAVLSVFTADWRATWRIFSSRKVLWAPVLFFLLYAASYFWSEDKDTASWAISSKLALLLLPVVLGAGAPVNDRELRWILRAAVAGVAGIALYCLGYAWAWWQETGDVSLFFYHNLVTSRSGQLLTLEANAVYMALYAYTALAVLLSGLVGGRNRWTTAVFSFLAALPIAAFFVLLSARTLLVLFAVLPVTMFLLYRLRWAGRSLWPMLAVAMGVAIGIAAIIRTDNPIRQRFIDVASPDVSEAFLQDYRERQDWRFNNLTTRVFLWRVGLETVMKNGLLWKGAGAGDVHHLTDARMAALGVEGVYDPEHPSHLRHINMHNMPLQSLLAVGIFGLLLLLVMMLAPVFHRVPDAEGILWWSLAVTFAVFMLQESALQTQAGIVPFALFSNLFWNRYWQVKMRRKGTPVKSV